MGKSLGKEYTNKIERVAFLKDNCDACENKGYMKPYTPEELQGHKENLANVNNKIDRAVKENGDRTDNFAQMVNSNLPESFTVQMPIFKGMSPETIEVETFAQVNGREVSFVLLSPGAQATLEDLRDKVIDEELSKIREIAPEIAIIEI